METVTETAPVTGAPKAEAIKETVAQKTAALTAEKATKTTQLSGMAADAPERASTEERIKVIDRKLRWYEGRNGEGKVAKADRPSKAASKSSRGSKTAKVEAPAIGSPVTAASES